MPIREYEFCPLCGAQVNAKDDEQAENVKSRFDIILGCTCCDFEGKVCKTFSLVKEYTESGTLKIQYMKFPVTYKVPEEEASDGKRNSKN